MGCVATLVVLKTTAVRVNNWDLRIFDRFTESTTIRHPLTIRQKLWHRPTFVTSVRCDNKSVHGWILAKCAKLNYFTARRYAIAVHAMALCLCQCLCLCLYVSVSVTSQCSTKMDKYRIKQTTPHNSTWILFFRCQKSPWNSTGVIPYGGAKCRWGGLTSTTFDK